MILLVLLVHLQLNLLDEPKLAPLFICDFWISSGGDRREIFLHTCLSEGFGQH